MLYSKMRVSNLKSFINDSFGLRLILDTEISLGFYVPISVFLYSKCFGGRVSEAAKIKGFL